MKIKETVVFYLRLLLVCTLVVVGSRICSGDLNPYSVSMRFCCGKLVQTSSFAASSLLVWFFFFLILYCNLIDMWAYIKSVLYYNKSNKNYCTYWLYSFCLQYCFLSFLTSSLKKQINVWKETLGKQEGIGKEGKGNDSLKECDPYWDNGGNSNRNKKSRMSIKKTVNGSWYCRSTSKIWL